MSEPAWVREDVVLAIHSRQIAEHGGEPGLRDANLLSSGLARPRDCLACAEPSADAADFAAAYAFGLCRNHPFIDGNKRLALVVSRLFLALNGWELNAAQADKYIVLMRLAAGEMDEPHLAVWFRQRLVPAPGRNAWRP